MGLIKFAYKTAKITAEAAVLYASSMYIADKYAQSYTEGKAHPVAATIEKIGDDAGDLVKRLGICAAKVVQAAEKKGNELADKLAR